LLYHHYEFCVVKDLLFNGEALSMSFELIISLPPSCVTAIFWIGLILEIIDAIPAFFPTIFSQLIDRVGRYL
jgi:hypothetical protein